MHARVEGYGLYGDRSHAIVDTGKQGWDRFITARTIPHMLGYRAVFENEDDAAAEFPPLRITAPDGSIMRWDRQLLAHFQQQTSRDIALERHSPHAAGLLAVDTASVLIVTGSSLREVERMWGKALDRRRFRANLLIELSEDKPFAETKWLNRRIAIGSAAFRIDEPCERCTVVTLDPDLLHKDPSLLNLLHRQTGLTFGVYASVVAKGGIAVGDPVRLE